MAAGGDDRPAGILGVGWTAEVLLKPTTGGRVKSVHQLQMELGKPSKRIQRKLAGIVEGGCYLWWNSADVPRLLSLSLSLSLSSMGRLRLRQRTVSSYLPCSTSASLWKFADQVLPGVMRVNGRLVLVGDGIKIGKQGRKMPAVKSLHQESESNTKPKYIMGHSLQAFAVLVQRQRAYSRCR